MTLSAQYSTFDKSMVQITLHPGDAIGTESVQPDGAPRSIFIDIVNGFGGNEFKELFSNAKISNGVITYGDPSIPIADYIAPSQPMPDISDRQFGMGLWTSKTGDERLISYQEFIDFVGSGKIPDAVQKVINTLPDDDTGDPTPRKMATGFVTGSKLYNFNNPLVEAFRLAQFEIDPKWTLAYQKSEWLRWSTL